MLITFVVKGKRDAADEATTSRYICAARMEELKTETVYQTTEADLERLAQWFADQPALIPDSGYPDGTLLIYSIHDKRERDA